MYYAFMGFRENLKNEIEYQNIKTKELAEKSGVNKRTIDHYLMSNPQEPSASTAVKIAKALKVSVEYLVTGENINNYQTFSKEIIDFLALFSKLSAEEKKVILELISLLIKK